MRTHGAYAAPDRGRASPPDGGPDPDVQVIVVQPERLHDRGWAAEVEPRAGEDPLGARGDEAVDEILREASIDLRHACG